MNRNRAAFEAFHAARPDVYQDFCNRVEKLWAKGRRHYSADGILHAIRYDSEIDGRPDDQFKINNNFSAFYSRMWRNANPSRESFFETRKQKSAQQ